ncbi:MAG: DUF2214 family protein [Bacteroidia bacterium]
MNTTLLLPAVMAFVHHVLAFALLTAVVTELITFSARPTLREAQRIQQADLIYGLSAILVVAVGFMRAGMFEKGWSFYSHNVFFWVKIGLLSLAGLLSIYPTVRFLKWRPAIREGQAPIIEVGEVRLIRKILWAETILVAAVLLAAPLMSRAVWTWG